MINLKELTHSQLEQCLKEAIGYCSGQMQRPFESLSKDESDAACSIYGVVRNKKNKFFFVGVICYVVEDLSEFVTINAIMKETKDRRVQSTRQS